MTFWTVGNFVVSGDIYVTEYFKPRLTREENNNGNGKKTLPLLIISYDMYIFLTHKNFTVVPPTFLRLVLRQSVALPPFCASTVVPWVKINFSQLFLGIDNVLE